MTDLSFFFLFWTLTFHIELSKLQFFFVIPEQEVKVLPGYLLLVLEPCLPEHGLDDFLDLGLRQAVVGDLNEGSKAGSEGCLVSAIGPTSQSFNL